MFLTLGPEMYWPDAQRLSSIAGYFPLFRFRVEALGTPR